MVMTGDSCSKGRGVNYEHLLLDGHFSHLFVVTIVWKDEKEAGDGPLFK